MQLERRPAEGLGTLSLLAGIVLSAMALWAGLYSQQQSAEQAQSPLQFRSTTGASSSVQGNLAVPVESEIMEHMREIERLENVAALLMWDEQTTMPPGPRAVEARNAQRQAVAAVLHRMKTEDRYFQGLERLQETLVMGGRGNDSMAHKWRLANVREAYETARLARAVPEEVAAREASLAGEAFAAWREAREKNDWSIFAPYLEQVVALRKTLADLKYPKIDYYAGMMEDFTRGFSAYHVSELFSELKRELLPILRQVRAAQPPAWTVPDALKPGEHWTKEGQRGLVMDIAKALGFDFDHGRLDVSMHPFMGGPGPNDVRFTVKYSNDFRLSVGAGAHEVGHALYEQGRPHGANADLPISRVVSAMETHESQSLLYQRMVWQSRPFATFVLPLMHKHFPHTKNVTADDLYRAINEVSPGLIRIEADELHYPFHVILRYEIEQGLADGSIAVEDIPQLWRDKMMETIGTDPGEDLSKGALQDIHWSILAMGYFPSYTLGALTAAQLFETLQQELPNLFSQLETGDVGDMLQWLREHVHSRGSFHATSDDLLREVTGLPLRVQPFIDYVRAKYVGVGGLYAAASPTKEPVSATPVEQEGHTQEQD